ncbi:hypothetical protein Abol_015_220 [Acetobacter orleanensis JCM 7639]|nr:hypothetical protein Abol_015_220 [Acetobacter orleanensis JCM 7639]
MRLIWNAEWMQECAQPDLLPCWTQMPEPERFPSRSGRDRSASMLKGGPADV